MYKKGFTLIELAVVLLVIGILAAVILRNIGTQGIQARDARRVGDLRNVSVYVAQYLAKFGSFPTSTSWSELETVLSKSQIASTPLPNDPSGPPRTYTYKACSDTGNAPNAGSNPGLANHFVLGATLEQSQASNPRIYDGSGTVPGNWQCGDGAGANEGRPSCDVANKEYCIVN
jgi:prepilin-type N-terminal cleavage/methylation domain-containing protein